MVFFVFFEKSLKLTAPWLIGGNEFPSQLGLFVLFSLFKVLIDFVFFCGWLVELFIYVSIFFLLFLSLNQLCNTNCFPSLIKLPGGSFPSWSGGELGVQINRALIGLVVWFVCLPHCARVSCCNEGLTGVCCGYHSMQWSVPCKGNSSCFVFLARPIEKLLPPSAEAVYVLNNFTVLLNKEICIFL